ncbi:MAG TPA: nodulation protein NfeD [Actinomycetes bacterium]|jgi:membrane-bound serine protease (ClpP class)|nr:nodulation protein NfeD [Actinomycetes bacterium]
MRIVRCIAAILGASLLLAVGPAMGARAQSPARPVRVLELDGAVDPFVASYLAKGIDSAARDGSAAVVIRIDTPGGLDSSMRRIVKAITASPVPVLCWTGPTGSRAASAGTFIMYACPQSAMAPGTNIGAAHPVGVSGAIEQKKVTNDAVAFIRSLADRNGYDANWAEDAVRKAAAIPAEEAVRKGVTKRLASSIPELLREVDGLSVPVSQASEQVTLHTAGATLQQRSAGLGVGLLHALIDPNLAFIFFYLGIILIIIEVLHPGISVPGVLGTLLLVTSVVSFGILPVQLGGVVLLVASAVLYLLELKHPGIGLPAIGGTICLVLGGLLLFDPSMPNVHVSRWLLVVVPALVVAFFAVVVQAALEARQSPPMIGVDHLYGEEGLALTPLDPRGEVRVGHEEWSAEAVGGTIAPGTHVRVVGRSGLKLMVVADPNHLGGGEPSVLPARDVPRERGDGS